MSSIPLASAPYRQTHDADGYQPMPNQAFIQIIPQSNNSITNSSAAGFPSSSHGAAPAPQTMIEIPVNTPKYQVRGMEDGCFRQMYTFNCLRRGGCCRQAPAKLIANPNGQLARINLMLRVRECCSNEGTGLHDTVPEELFLRGVPVNEFNHFMWKLEEVGRLRRSICKQFCTVLGCMWVPCLWKSCCVKHANEVYVWSDALKKWQDEFNAYLIPRGVMVKTQSNCVVTYDRNGKRRHIERWIAFALTQEEVTALSSEPHLLGDVEQGCCNSVDERRLMLHP